MSRSTVRAAIHTYLTAGLPGIPGLQKVFKAAPWFADGSAVFNLAAGAGSGAFAWLHLTSSTESRRSVPAVLGVSSVHYEVSIVVAYQYLIPSAGIDTTLTEDMWVDDCDAILQGIKDRIHADPELGAPGVILLAAQTPMSLRIDSDDPIRESGKVWSWHTVEFQITEIITA